MPAVAALWRHPIKGHGREALNYVTLIKGQTMPWDRRWAVAHELAHADNSRWSPCANFSRGSKNGALMAIDAHTDETSGTITLTHPDLTPLTFDPDNDEEAFLNWVRPLMPAHRAQSTRIVRVEGRGMTDTNYPSVSLLNLASNTAVTKAMGHDISPLRWRCNIHLTDAEPWEEFDWIGKTLRVGAAELKIEERILRCKAVTANPSTGMRDSDPLGALNTHFGHQDFGVCATVISSGAVEVGDSVEVVV